jgi:excisionase family DNA binding protein
MVTNTSSLLTVDEVARTLGVSPATVRRMIARGDLDALKLGDGRSSPIRVPGAAVARFLTDARERVIERRAA